jgi:hypothetical protein
MIIVSVISRATNKTRLKSVKIYSDKFLQVTSIATFSLFFYMSFTSGLWAGYSEKYINQMWAVSGLFVIALISSFAMANQLLTFSKMFDLLPLGLLFSLCCLYAIGSGNGFVAQLTGASGFIAIAAIYALDLNVANRKIGVPLLSLLLLAGSLQVTREAVVHPYRQPPRSAQTFQLTIREGYGKVYVDSQLRELVLKFRNDMSASGWTSQTRLLDLTSYSAGLVFILDGRPPLTIIPTVGIYPTVNQVAEWALRETLQSDNQWRDAWLLLPADPINADTLGRPSTDVLKVIGRTFPNDYEEVSTSYGYSIWKLKEG